MIDCSDFAAATEAVKDPVTPAEVLEAIAHAQPGLWAEIASHDAATSALLDWLDGQGDDFVQAVVAARRAFVQRAEAARAAAAAEESAPAGLTSQVTAASPVGAVEASVGAETSEPEVVATPPEAGPVPVAPSDYDVGAAAAAVDSVVPADSSGPVEAPDAPVSGTGPITAADVPEPRAEPGVGDDAAAVPADPSGSVPGGGPAPVVSPAVDHFALVSDGVPLPEAVSGADWENRVAGPQPHAPVSSAGDATPSRPVGVDRILAGIVARGLGQSAPSAAADGSPGASASEPAAEPVAADAVGLVGAGLVGPAVVDPEPLGQGAVESGPLSQSAVESGQVEPSLAGPAQPATATDDTSWSAVPGQPAETVGLAGVDTVSSPAEPESSNPWQELWEPTGGPTDWADIFRAGPPVIGPVEQMSREAGDGGPPLGAEEPTADGGPFAATPPDAGAEPAEPAPPVTSAPTTIQSAGAWVVPTDAAAGTADTPAVTVGPAAWPVEGWPLPAAAVVESAGSPAAVVESAGSPAVAEAGLAWPVEPLPASSAPAEAAGPGSPVAPSEPTEAESPTEGTGEKTLRLGRTLAPEQPEEMVAAGPTATPAAVVSARRRRSAWLIPLAILLVAVGASALWFGLSPTNSPQQSACVDNAQVFADILPGSTFYAATCWMVDKGIVDVSAPAPGQVPADFQPGERQSRHDAAIALYRAGGSPSVAMPTIPPFPDVLANDQGYVAVVWLADRGIVKAGDSFRPTDIITRGEWSAWLYAFMGSPAVTTPDKPPFVDVAADDPNYDAIVWLAGKGVATGFGGSQVYRPDQPLTRGASAVYLYRLLTS